MDYRDEDYLNLFKQVKEKNVSYPLIDTNSFNGQMIKETPDYNNYNSGTMIKETPNYTNYNENFRNFSQQNVNEVQRNNYAQDFNINEFVIETRINGENINEVKRQSKEDRLNEVMQQMRQDRLNEVKKNEDNRNLNETVNFKDVDYVSVEMFEKARYNSMMQVAHRILPR